jgi:hypothetical protein
MVSPATTCEVPPYAGEVAGPALREAAAGANQRQPAPGQRAEVAPDAAFEERPRRARSSLARRRGQS